MRTAAVFAKDTAQLMSKNPTVQTVLVSGVSVTCGLVARANDIPSQLPPGHVLVRVRAFSCNYRDKALILQTAMLARPSTFCGIGSDFCAEVLDSGAGVIGFSSGDIVILNPTQTTLSTRHGSREYQVLPAIYLLRAPQGTPVEELAALGVAAKTAYGLIRISQVKPPMKVLVTAGRSSVSLALVHALEGRNIRPDVITTSTNLDARFEKLNVGKVLHVISSRSDNQISNCNEVVEHARAIGGYDAVFDPFFTSYFENLVHVLKPGAIYASCGYGSDFSVMNGGNRPISAPPLPPSHSMKAALVSGMVNNVELRLLTLGNTEDLQRALQDFGQGSYRAPLDQVFECGDVGRLIERTYSSAERIGRAVYRYN